MKAIKCFNYFNFKSKLSSVWVMDHGWLVLECMQICVMSDSCQIRSNQIR